MISRKTTSARDCGQDFQYQDTEAVEEVLQCATGNPVPVPVDPVDFFRSGSGPVPAKYRPDRPDLTRKFGCRI